MKFNILIFALFFIIIGFANAQEKSEQITVQEIVQKSNHMSLYQGSDMKGKVSMKILDKQGRIRKRVFNMLRKNCDPNSNDQKYYTFFLSPADVRKMVFMVHKNTGAGQDDDRWMYMPSLDLVKRIAASDKRTSFVGSNFLYEDISGRNINEDLHELISTTDQYYIIKNIPKQPLTVEFEYYKAYIDKTTFLPMKLEYYKKGDKIYRIIKNEKVEQINAIENQKQVSYPTVIKSMAKDLETNTITEMIFSNIKYNIGVDDKIFTERYLRSPPRKLMR